MESPRALFRNKSLRNVAVLMTGTAVSQVILLLAAPVLSRLYDPAAFGVWSLFVAVAAIVSPLMHMQYGPAVLLPKDDRDGAAVFWLGNTITVCLSLVALVVVAVWRDPIADSLSAPELAEWLWGIPLLLLLSGSSEVLEYWATRRKRYWGISARRIARSVGQVAVQVPAGALGKQAGGLIAGTIVGQFVETATLGVQVLRRDARLLRESLQASRMRRVAAEFKTFPQYGAPATMLNSVSQSIPTFILSGFFGTSLVGLYGMALRVLVYPSSFLTSSLRQVLLQEAADTEARGESNLPRFRKATLWLACLVALPTIAVMAFGPWLFSAILGAEWEEAGVYARWLVLWIACGVVNVPASAVLQVLRRQRLLLGLEVGLLAGRIVALVIPGCLGRAHLAIAAYAAVGIAVNLVMIVSADIILRRRLGASDGPSAPRATQADA
jgi:O-antigen/teichoic acid export membrane protein